MKVVILAGGFGTRLAEYTESIPKPMVTVGGKPIIWHIMKHYAKYGYTEFVVACGYKSEAIKSFFANYYSSAADFTVDLSNGSVEIISEAPVNWKVTLVDTGVGTLTGARIKQLQPIIGNEPFLLTYGDGLSDVNLTELVKFHKEKGTCITLTSVRPSARFGELTIENGIVSCFEEKPQLHSGWINGGFFVVEPEFFNFINENEDVMLEREPLTRAVESGQLSAYMHGGFWQCMDTKRDRDLLEKLWDSGSAPWVLN
jgi:glucose-1-phosphate cytidylyltransferase